MRTTTGLRSSGRDDAGRRYSTMTNRERVRAAVRRKRVERVPMNDSFYMYTFT